MANSDYKETSSICLLAMITRYFILMKVNGCGFCVSMLSLCRTRCRLLKIQSRGLIAQGTKDLVQVKTSD